MGYLDTSARIRRTVMAELPALPDNFVKTRSQGVAEFAIGETFCSTETGIARRYERIADAPGYQDMGDEAAPATRKSVDAAQSLAGQAMDVISLSSWETFANQQIPAQVKRVTTAAYWEGYPGLGSASYAVDRDQSDATGANRARQKNGARWWVLASDIITPEMFGAKSARDGSDDAPAINAANDFCKVRGKTLMFPGALYAWASPVYQSVLWGSLLGGTKMVISPEFTPDSNGAALLNKNFALTWNANADAVGLTGFDFIFRSLKNAAMIKYGNVRSGEVYQVTGITDTVAQCDPLFDLHACVKNFRTRQSQFRNLTRYFSGGCMWTRNRCDDGSIPENVTENIVFEDCYFEQTTTDEAWSIFGSRGLVRAVQMIRCKTRSLLTGLRRSHLTSVFVLSSTQYSAVQGVKIIDCDTYEEMSDYTALRIGGGGGSYTTANPTFVPILDDIEVRGGRIRINRTATNLSTCASRRDAGTNVRLTSVEIDGENSAIAMPYPLFGFKDGIVRCNVHGRFQALSSACTKVSSSTFSSTGSTSDRPGLYGLQANTSETYVWTDNDITLTDTSGSGAYALSFSDGSGNTKPTGLVLRNRVRTASAASRMAFMGKVDNGAIAMIDNIAEGVGGGNISGNPDLVGPRVGNSFYGTRDLETKFNSAGDTSPTLLPAHSQALLFANPLTADRVFTFPATASEGDTIDVLVHTTAGVTYKVRSSLGQRCNFGRTKFEFYGNAWRIVSRTSLSVAVDYNLPALAAGAVDAVQTVTLNGASRTYAVMPSFSFTATGVSVEVRASGENTVQFRFINRTGAATPASTENLTLILVQP